MIVSVSDLRFHYGKAHNTPVLAIPRWSVDPGERVFLHGPSGSGKSTLLNLLAGMQRATDGSVEILGKRLETLTGRERDKLRARYIGVVFQQFNLIPYLSSLDNIRLAARFAGTVHAGGRAEELLRALELEGNLFHQPAARLSVGQQQRVAIARALINRPELLLVDEPTSALDGRNRDAFMSLLLNQVRCCGATLIFVSHDTALASAFSRVQALGDINRAGDRI